jgi:plastocyanin
MRMRRAAVAIGALAVAGASADAGQTGPQELTISKHRFDPAEIDVPAGQAAMLHVRNLDPTAEEFDSSALKVEKVIGGNGEATIRLRPLAPGRYNFMGEYHSSTARGVVVAK